jgi:RNA-directed DNA polymerase
VEGALQREIVRHAKGVIRKYELKRWVARKHARNYEKRTGKSPVVKPVALPDIWNLHPHFDPKYCISQSKNLAHHIWEKIKQGTYQPMPALARSIPKPNGEYRQIMVFPIPDAAVAKLFRSRLTKRNAKIFLANSYAYRFDKNLFDALLYVQAALTGEKLFLIQYDFRKYFDSISHQYLRRLVESERTFLTSKVEQGVIRAFLGHRYAEQANYVAKAFTEKEIGIPQGSSISLWLANVAGHELDSALEKMNGQYARYADDVVCICRSYEDALGIATAFEDHCKRAGLSINKEKSPGINLFASDKEETEMRKISYFDFLGHRFTKGGICLTDKAVERIKQRITRIIQVHLLHYPKKQKAFNKSRLGGTHFDWDLVTCLNEVRRYIYGGLKEADIEGLIHRNVRLPKVKGLMSFYVLMSDPGQLSDLDGWLLNSVRRALTERYKVIGANFGLQQKPPTKAQLKNGGWYTHPTIRSETRCPSFLRGWRGARKYFLRFGLGDVTPPLYYGY